MHQPTQQEIEEHAIRARSPVELGIGTPATGAAFAAELEAQYSDHLILIQAGKFLHGFDRTAYALHVLKKYKLVLVGTNADPHLRIGFPVAQHQRRLWKVLDEFGVPYVVALGTQTAGHTLYESDKPRAECSVLASVSSSIVADVIRDLQNLSKLNATAATELLKHPERATFQFKDKVQELDTLLTQDVARMPRDLRSYFGENIRQVMFCIVNGAMAYGLADNRVALLRSLSAHIDQLKHYLVQSQKIGQFKGKFDHRAGLAVEIGRLVGGLIQKGAAA